MSVSANSTRRVIVKRLSGIASPAMLLAEEVVKNEIESLFSLGEIPADDDVAEAVVLFLSDRLRMVTGEFLRVDAGQLKRL